MYLTQLYPELLSKTIWSVMPEYAKKYIWSVIQHEQEFGKPLPKDAFYKMVAISAIKNAQLAFREVV